MLPFLGAAAKAAEVARNMRRGGRALNVVRRPVGSLSGGWPGRHAA
jgi:hypothetical protein